MKYYRKSRCISPVFETTNHAKLLDLDLYRLIPTYTESKSIQSITKKYKMLWLILGGRLIQRLDFYTGIYGMQKIQQCNQYAKKYNNAINMQKNTTMLNQYAKNTTMQSI